MCLPWTIDRTSGACWCGRAAGPRYLTKHSQGAPTPYCYRSLSITDDDDAPLVAALDDLAPPPASPNPCPRRAVASSALSIRAHSMSMSLPPAALRLAHHAALHAQLLAPLLLAVLGTVASINSPVQHSLLVTSLSWAAVCLPAVVRVGLYSNSPSPSRGRTPSLLAGALLALAHICDRAACDKDGIRATKWLLPLFVVAAAAVAAQIPAALPALPSLTGPSDSPPSTRSLRLLLALTAAAAAALAVYVTSTTAALGISSAFFAAWGLVGFEAATRETKDDGGGARGFMAADGSVTRRNSLGASHRLQQLAALRDVAAALVVVCGIAAFLIEPSVAPGATTWEPMYREFDRDWKTVHDYRTMRQVVFMVLVNIVLNGLVYFVVCETRLSLPRLLTRPARAQGRGTPLSLGIVRLHLRAAQVCYDRLGYLVHHPLRRGSALLPLRLVAVQQLHRHPRIHSHSTHYSRSYNSVYSFASFATGLGGNPSSKSIVRRPCLQYITTYEASSSGSDRSHPWTSGRPVDSSCRDRVPQHAESPVQNTGTGCSRVPPQERDSAATAIRQVVRICQAPQRCYD